VAAIPAVGLSIGPTKAQSDVHVGDTEDKLGELITRYRAEIAAINAKHDDLSEEDIDAWHDRANSILSAAARTPALNTASAIAALDLVVEEEDIGEHSIFGDHFKGLIKTVRDYIASTEEVQS